VCCSLLQCVAVCCIVLHFSSRGKTYAFTLLMCCSVVWCVAACCSVLQCGAVCCWVLALVAKNVQVLFQCVVMCSSVLQCIADWRSVLLFTSRGQKHAGSLSMRCNILCSVVVCRSVVHVCCNMAQCVTVCCSV